MGYMDKIMNKPGRNQPCYCGSGKKYKQCHMKIDQAAEQEKRAMADAVGFVRRDLLKFARNDEFAEDFAKALPYYWNNLYELDNAEEMSQDEALRFFDWFVFDYQPEAEDSKRLIELYYEQERENLSTAQQKVIDGWKTAPPSGAYELLAYEGQNLTLADFFSGEQFEVFEASGRGNVEIGEVILTRLVQVQDQLEFSTTAAYLPADEIGDLKERMLEKKTAVPEQSHEAFMRQNNVMIIHHALAEAKKKDRPQVARLDPNRPDKKTQKIVRNMRRLRR